MPRRWAPLPPKNNWFNRASGQANPAQIALKPYPTKVIILFTDPPQIAQVGPWMAPRWLLEWPRTSQDGSQGVDTSGNAPFMASCSTHACLARLALELCKEGPPHNRRCQRGGRRFPQKSNWFNRALGQAIPAQIALKPFPTKVVILFADPPQIAQAGPWMAPRWLLEWPRTSQHVPKVWTRLRMLLFCFLLRTSLPSYASVGPL